MPEHLLPRPIDGADIKALTAAQNRNADELAQLRATIKQVSDEAPEKVKDVTDHGALITVGLMILYFALTAAVEWVKKQLHSKGQDVP